MHNLKGILTANGVHSYWDVNTNTQLVGDYKIAHAELEVLGVESYYEQTDLGAGFIPSGKVSLSSPALGVNTLGSGVDPLYSGPSGSRDSGTQFTAVPTGSNYAVIEVKDFEFRYMVRAKETDIVQAYHLRDNGRTATDGDVLILQSAEEIANFAFVSNSAAPLANPATALTTIAYYKKP